MRERQRCGALGTVRQCDHDEAAWRRGYVRRFKVLVNLITARRSQENVKELYDDNAELHGNHPIPATGKK